MILVDTLMDTVHVDSDFRYNYKRMSHLDGYISCDRISQTNGTWLHAEANSKGPSCVRSQLDMIKSEDQSLKFTCIRIDTRSCLDILLSAHAHRYLLCESPRAASRRAHGSPDEDTA